MNLVLKFACAVLLFVGASQTGLAGVVTYSFSSEGGYVPGYGASGPISFVAQGQASSISELDAALQEFVFFYIAPGSSPDPSWLPFTSASVSEPLGLEFFALQRFAPSVTEYDLFWFDFSSVGDFYNGGSLFEPGAFTKNGTYHELAQGLDGEIPGTLTVSGVPGSVPEPASMVLLGAGLGAIVLRARRRK